MKRNVLLQFDWVMCFVLSQVPAALATDLGRSTNTGISYTVTYGGTGVVAIGTGSSGKTDTSGRDQKAGYAFRFYYCDARPEMNPTEATIKAYTSSGNWVCLFYEGGGYEPGTPRSARSGNQCRCRALTGGYEGGQHDAAIAYAQAADMGMPLGRPVFFTLDTDPGPTGKARMKKVIEYFRGAADWAHCEGYTVGCYGGSYLLMALFDQNVIDFGEETTGWCHHFHEIRSQIRQEGPGPYAAYAQDYGQWRWHEAPTSATYNASGSTDIRERKNKPDQGLKERL
jgi:hypothetical protein